MNIRQLEVFQAIMSAGSLTGAARTLKISQPAVSAVVKDAETQLKMKLFKSISGRLHPTPEAIALLPFVNDVFSRIESLDLAAERLRDGQLGQIMLASTGALLHMLFPLAFIQFKKIAPHVGMSIHSGQKPFVIERVSQKESDLGLLYGPVAHAGIEVEELFSTELECAIPKHHSLAAKHYISAQDLNGEYVIGNKKYSTIGSLVDAACREAGVEPPKFSLEASFSFNPCLLVNAGAGIALLDPFIKMTGMVDNVIFRPFRPAVKIKTQIIYPRDRPRSKATQLFVDQLRAITHTA